LASLKSRCRNGEKPGEWQMTNGKYLSGGVKYAKASVG